MILKSAAHLLPESSPEGAGPVGGAEPGSHLTSDITAAFNTFNSQLDHYFTVSADTKGFYYQQTNKVN